MSNPRDSWGEGPWQNEPDRKEWRDEATGLPCLILRHPILGTLCGYVAVPPGHPWHGKHYSDIDAIVHGGVTFAAPCDEEGLVCHVPEPGEPGDVWWLGFDCSHAFDMVPGIEVTRSDTYRDYRDLAFVEKECANLARAAVALERRRRRRRLLRRAISQEKPQ